jgi:MarR family transcriptional regulator for hemolysin
MISRRSTPQLTTYQKARLQVVGYRTIQAQINKVLERRSLNTSQWVILGWLRDNPEGLRVTKLAEVLAVETPLITNLVQPMQAAGHVDSVADTQDKRAKRLTLTEKGDELVRDLEVELGDHMQNVEAGFKRNELDAYFSALERFVQNAADHNRGS